MPPPSSSTGQALLAAALAHLQAGRLRDAEAAYRQVLALAPGHAGASFNLAVALRGQGRLDEAAAQYRHVIGLDPRAAQAHNSLATVLARQGMQDEAISHYERALALQPDYANAHFNYANLLRERGDSAAAADHYRRALAARPDDAEAHNNLGAALAADGRPEEAISHYRRAIALRPGDAEALGNLASALADIDRPQEAMAHYARALALRPEHLDAPFNARAHSNIGVMLQRQGRREEALAHYARAQALAPDYADAHWNEALARLLSGDFERGWRKYEWRLRRKETLARQLAAPMWDGGPLAGRTILLHAEQGQGDAIQFVRYAPTVKALGAEVVLEAPGVLAPLFADAAGVDRFVAAGEPLPSFDVHAPLLSLPVLFGTTLETIPAAGPYLRAEPARIEAWRARLSDLPGAKVGLVWRGSPTHANDRRRSMPAAAMAGLARLPGVSPVSVQLDARPEEFAAFAPVRPYDAAAHIRDWGDTAGLIEALDLVVTVDTAVAHLAGALGKPAWVLIPFAPDWRWLLGRGDSPWYPSLRLFRQPAPGDWDAVLRRVGEALARFR